MFGYSGFYGAVSSVRYRLNTNSLPKEYELLRFRMSVCNLILLLLSPYLPMAEGRHCSAQNKWVAGTKVLEYQILVWPDQATS